MLVQVGPGQHEAVHRAVERAGHQAAEQRDRLRVRPTSSSPMYGITGQHVAGPVDAHQQGQPDGQAAERRGDLGADAVPGLDSESMTRHRPPRNRICTTGSL